MNIENGISVLLLSNIRNLTRRHCEEEAETKNGGENKVREEITKNHIANFAKKEKRESQCRIKTKTRRNKEES